MGLTEELGRSLVVAEKRVGCDVDLVCKVLNDKLQALDNGDANAPGTLTIEHVRKKNGAHVAKLCEDGANPVNAKSRSVWDRGMHCKERHLVHLRRVERVALHCKVAALDRKLLH